MKFVSGVEKYSFRKMISKKESLVVVVLVVLGLASSTRVQGYWIEQQNLPSTSTENLAPVKQQIGDAGLQPLDPAPVNSPAEVPQVSGPTAESVDKIQSIMVPQVSSKGEYF